jgi:hypothetical protein
MRPAPVIFLMVSAGGYAYCKNPHGCKKFGHDLQNLLISLLNPSSTDAGSPPAPDTSLSTWKPPDVIPSEPHWNWTTPKGTYREVKIVKVEADCVTILHEDGGCLVPIAMLSPDLQKQLKYDPAAAAAAARQRAQGDSAPQQEAQAEVAGAARLGQEPIYPRAMIGRVVNVLPDGIVVQGLPMDHIHPEFDPGVDHECFAGAGGPSFVRGIRMVYGVGDKIEIMVNLTGESRVVPVDPTHTTQVQVCDELSDNLAFRVGVNWGP